MERGFSNHRERMRSSLPGLHHTPTRAPEAARLPEAEGAVLHGE